MMNADIEPIGAGGGGGSGSPTVPSPAAQPIALGGTGGRLAGAKASVPLICRLSTACNGTLTLAQKPSAGASAARAKKRKKAPSFGSTHFSIAAGKTVAVTVHLNAAGRHFVRGRKKTVVYATVTVAGKRVTLRVALTAGKKH